MQNLNLEQQFAPIIIDKDVQCASLTKSDFIRLHNYLHQFNAEINNLAEFDGFLAVIAINPKSYYEEFLASIIYGVDFEKDEHKKIFNTKDQLDDFIDLLTRRILFLFEAIREYKLENMLLFDAKENNENTLLWLRGAVRAFMIFESDLIVFDSEEYENEVAIYSLLAYPEDVENDEERSLIAEIMQENIVEVVTTYLYILNDEITTTQSQKPETVKNSHKPSRNELCSCGSGKKYKKCCGQ